MGLSRVNTAFILRINTLNNGSHQSALTLDNGPPMEEGFLIGSGQSTLLRPCDRFWRPSITLFPNFSEKNLKNLRSRTDEKS